MTEKKTIFGIWKAADDPDRALHTRRKAWIFADRHACLQIGYPVSSLVWSICL